LPEIILLAYFFLGLYYFDTLFTDIKCFGKDINKLLLATNMGEIWIIYFKELKTYL